MDTLNSQRAVTGLVEKYIGTAYDKVKIVADNIDDVIALGSIDGIEDIMDNINAAEGYANAAAQSATEAAASALEADTTVQAFNDFYLGPKGTPPTVDNDGDPLTIGALYLDTATSPNLMKFWDSIQWLVSYADPLSIPHGDFGGLDADDHTQYLTSTRHAAIPGNPHNTLFTDLDDTPVNLVGSGGKALRVATNELSVEFSDISSDYLALSGGDLTGPVESTSYFTTLASPTAPDQLTRKDYVDTNFLA